MDGNIAGPPSHLETAAGKSAAARTAAALDYRSFFHDSGDAMVATNTEARIIDANPAAARLSGYTHEELAGMDAISLFAPDQASHVLSMLDRKVRHDEAATRYESVFMTKSGVRVPVEVVTTLVAAPGKQPVIHAIVRDISERKRLEESLRQQASVMAQVSAAIIGVAQDLHVCEWNPQAEALLGWTAAETLGRIDVLRLFPPEERERVELLTDLAAKGQRWQGEMTMMRQSGALVPCRISLGPSRDSDGQVNGGLLVCVDNSRERRVEEALRQSQRFTQAVLDTLHRQTAILDDEGLIIQVNDRWRLFADVNGLPVPGYGIGASYLDICDRAAVAGCDDAARVAEGIRQVLAGDCESFAADYSWEDATGSHTFEVMVERAEWNGPPRLVVGHADITARVEAQRQALRTQGRLLRLLHLSPEPVIIEDADCNILFFSKAAEEMFGCAGHAAVGRTALQFIPERYHEAHRNYVRSYVAEEEDSTRHIGRRRGVAMRRMDGTEFRVHITSARLVENGEITFAGFLQEIPEAE